MAKQMFVTALLLVIIVFVIGVVVGNVWRFGGSNEVSKELRSSELYAESFLVEQVEGDCGKVNNIVLFYFKKDDPLSAEQGRVLDDLVSQFSMHVFAVELNYSKELNFIEEYYW